MTSDALIGTRVLDLSHGIAGPFAARLLGDFGADVIKIEKPETGDFCRYLPPVKPDAPPPEHSLLFQYLNWNKRSVALDLRKSTVRSVIKALVQKSDILIESFRPGTLASWGMGVEQLLEWNPKLVVTSITNFGQTGPYAHYEATDLIFQAMSGVMSISGQVDREPLKHGLDQSLYCAGLNAAYITAAMLQSAQSDGFGEHIDLSIHECLSSELVLNEPFYAFMGAVQGRRAVIQDPFLGEPIRSKQGYLTLQTGGGAPFETYAELFGREEFLMPEYSTASKREANAGKVRQLLEECLADRDAQSVFEEGASKRLLLGVVQSAQDLLKCEHLAARQFFKDVEHPVSGTIRFPGALANLSETPMTIRKRAPLLDEHRQQILSEMLGLSTTEIQKLTSESAVNEAQP